jgi:hypothetical protein
MEAHAEIMGNPFAAVTGGVGLASTNDFTDFDAEHVAPGSMSAPFCARTRIPFEEIGPFLERLRELGLIGRVDLSTCLDPFAPLQSLTEIEEREPRLLEDGSLALDATAPAQSRPSLTGLWTATDLHSRAWLDGYQRARAKEIHRAMLGESETKPVETDFETDSTRKAV